MVRKKGDKKNWLNTLYALIVLFCLLGAYFLYGMFSQAQTYHDEIGKYTIDYPKDWNIDTHEDTQPGFGSTSGMVLTSPNGSELKISAYGGGLGGSCLAAKQDVPHKKGNNCPTMEYLSKEPTNIPQYNLEKEELYVITARYTDTEGKSQYLIGLTNLGIFKLSEPIMGYVLPRLEFSGGSHDIIAYASSPSQDFLTSEDGLRIKEILKSIKLDE